MDMLPKTINMSMQFINLIYYISINKIPSNFGFVHPPGKFHQESIFIIKKKLDY